MIYSAVLEVKLDSSGMIPTCVSGASVPSIVLLGRAEGLRLSVCTYLYRGNDSLDWHCCSKKSCYIVCIRTIVIKQGVLKIGRNKITEIVEGVLN